MTLAASGGTTAGTVVQATDSRLSDSRAPSGAAGGDLGGTYPNPTLNTITTAGKVSGNAITSGTIGGTTVFNSSGNVQTSGVLRLYDAGPTNYVNFKAPTSVTSNYTLTWPAAAPSVSGYVLTSDTSGNLSWSAPASGGGGGTVTSVTGTAPISIGGTATDPVVSVTAATTGAAGVVTLAASGGTTAGTVVQATDSRLSDSRAPSGAAGGDLGGTYPNPTLNTITTAGKVSGNAITSGTISGSTAINTSGLIQTSNAVRLFDSGPTNYVSFKAPSTVTSNYTLTWPAAVPGVAGYLLSSDTSGNLSWVAPAAGGGGTVTSVTGTAPISIGGTATDPVVSVTAATTGAAGVVTLAASGGTTAGTVVQATDARLSDSRAPSGSAGGDLGGTYPSPSVAKIQGTAVSSTAPSSAGQVLRYNGTTQFAPAFLGIADIKSTITPFGGAFASAGCTASQTLYWQSATDTFQCQTVSVGASNFGSQSQNAFLAGPSSGGAGAASFRSIVSADLPTSGVTAGTYNSVTVDAYGRVTTGSNVATVSGSGTANKVAMFSASSTLADSIITQSGTNQIGIAGQINSIGSTNQTSNLPTINFNVGNTVYASGNCQAITLQNMVDGGSYSLTMKGTSGTCTFTSSGDTVHYAGGASGLTISAHTVFSFMKMGTDVYVTWITF